MAEHNVDQLRRLLDPLAHKVDQRRAAGDVAAARQRGYNSVLHSAGLSMRKGTTAARLGGVVTWLTPIAS